MPKVARIIWAKIKIKSVYRMHMVQQEQEQYQQQHQHQPPTTNKGAECARKTSRPSIFLYHRKRLISETNRVSPSYIQCETKTNCGDKKRARMQKRLEQNEIK